MSDLYRKLIVPRLFKKLFEKKVSYFSLANYSICLLAKVLRDVIFAKLGEALDPVKVPDLFFICSPVLRKNDQPLEEDVDCNSKEPKHGFLI